MDCKKCNSSNTKIRDKQRELYLCNDCGRHFNANSYKLRGLIIDNKKWCNQCNSSKSIDEFYEAIDKGEKRLKSSCKLCCLEKQLLTKYRKYNLSKEEFDNLLISSDYKCNICSCNFKELPYLTILSKLFIDHCHQTGKVRGLLCGKCNSCIGLANDNIDILQKAIIYLNK